MSDLGFPLVAPAVHTGRTDLSLGYVPLTDAAPLLVAVWDERRTGVVPAATEEELVSEPE